MHSAVICKLENDIIPVKRAMEAQGIYVSLVQLEEVISGVFAKKLDKDKALRNAFQIDENVVVNFNSSKAVSELLFLHFGVMPVTTRTGRPSTTRRILRGVNNPVTESILEYRDLEQLLSSLKAIHAATNKETNRISCTYIDDCPTGRLYTKDYSLQSIPEAARHVMHADNFCTFVLADYSMFELRILSAIADDTYFKDCWARGLDLHCKVVSDMQGIAYDSITDKQRKLGKALNFGISYGQEPVGLARNLGIPTDKAEKLMFEYKRQIPEIEAYKLEVVKRARKTGLAETYYGRKRFLPNIISPVSGNRKKAERQAVNTVIQGTAADIVKFALVQLHQEGFIINTMLHDGILMTVRDELLEEDVKRIRDIMEVELEGMKLPVDIKTGKTWGECS